MEVMAQAKAGAQKPSASLPDWSFLSFTLFYLFIYFYGTGI
jgi:hypothetical protein